MTPETEPEGRLIQIGSRPQQGTVGLSFDLLADLLRGAAISRVDFFPNTGDLSFVLTGNRKLIVKKEASGYRLELDTAPTGNFVAPVPMIFPDYADFSLHKGARLMSRISSLYAILYLVKDGRDKELYAHLSAEFFAAPAELLNEDEKLIFFSICQGSFLGEFWTKTKKGLSIIQTIAMAASEKGRELILRRHEAEARIKEAEADAAHSKARLESAKAKQEELKVIESLVKLYDDRIANRAKDDPIRERFEEDIYFINRSASVNLLESDRK